MKKTHKQVVGLVSLGAVAAMTVFAATLPSPSAAAIGQVTDTILLQVVGETPDVTLVRPSSNITVVTPGQEFEFNYNNVSTVTVALTHTSENGTVTTVDNFINIVSDYTYDEFSSVLNLDDYGFGTFEFVITGEGLNGVTDTDAVVITYQWMDSNLRENDEGEPVIDLFYDDDPNDGDDDAPSDITITVVDPEGDVIYEITVTPPTDEVVIPLNEIPGLEDGDYTIIVEGTDEDGDTRYHEEYTFEYDNENNYGDEDDDIILNYDDNNVPEEIVVVVYNPDGDEIYHTTVTPPAHDVEIPFDDIPDLPDGDYTIVITGYGEGGEEGGKVIYTETIIYHYERVPVPNTGSFFKNLNVSKEDFLITGVIMFFVISIVGVGVIAKKRR